VWSFILYIRGPMTEALDWSRFSTGLITDCMGRFGAMDGGIHRIVGHVMSGPALTVQVIAGENGTIHHGLAVAAEGSVLVVAAGGRLDRAVWGEVLARAALARSIAGVVIDGAVRDVDGLRDAAIPTFARGLAPAGPHKGWPGRLGVPIACGGVVVMPGDTIVGDGDGVAVVAAEEASDIYELAVARQSLEAEWLERIASGESTVGVLALEREAHAGLRSNQPRSGRSR
jgi:4-hydroxy-4-methyl-2-oxoglutarate aldolase